jgi:3-oxoacyl-[acyl-carrier-protein] synthase II
MNENVFITGMGVITPIGLSTTEYMKNLLSGKSGVQPFAPLEELHIRPKKAAFVENFNPKELMPEINARRLSRYVQFAYAAAKSTLLDSGINPDDVDPLRKGLMFSTVRGSYDTTIQFLETLYTRGPGMVSPLKFSQTVMNAAATPVSLKYKLKGPGTVITGISPIPFAFRTMRSGKADFILAGGVDVISFLDPFIALDRENLLAHKENGVEENSYPMDRRRNGFVYGEAAAFILLERGEYVKKRNGHIYAEIVSHATVHDSGSIQFFNRRKVEPIVYVIRESIRRANIKPEEVDVVIGMANSTPGIDETEANALLAALGDRGYLYTTSKGATGETFGASFMLNVVLGAQILEKGIIPPVTNLKEPDRACAIPVVMEDPVIQDCRYALCLGFEAGGNVQAVLIKKYEGE